MKNKLSFRLIIAGLVIVSSLSFQNTNAQSVTKRLPDGTVIYSDGTIRLPNGQVRYPNTTNGTTYPTNYPNYKIRRYPRVAATQPDGSVIYPDGRIVYPDGTVRFPDGRVYSPSNNSRWMPPGQAKKIYGGNARDYAPGHNKHRDYDRDDRDERKHGKGHRHDD
jgi:hypothetical protein